MGRPSGVVARVADVAGHFGPGLDAGNVIITGAVAPALELTPGESYLASAPGLGEIRLSVAN